MTTRTATDRRVWRRAHQERADLADEIARLFRRRFGLQGALLQQALERALTGTATLPADAADLVATAWGEASQLSRDAGVRRIRAVMLEAQRRGHAELLRELAQSLGVNVRNRRQYRRFLRSISPGRLVLDQPAALARITAHVDNVIAKVDVTTGKRLDFLVRRSLAEGATAAEARATLHGYFSPMGQSKDQWRPRMIGDTEAFRAYEAGKARGAQQVIAVGARIVKRWLSGRDERVTEICWPNDHEGWVDNAHIFHSGHIVPPAHPRCRCVVRRKLVRASQ